MATDPNQQNVRISEIDSSIPAWASEATSQGILAAIKNGDATIANTIKGGDQLTARLISNMNTLMTNLISIMSGNKNAASGMADVIKQTQDDNAKIRQQLDVLRSTMSNVDESVNNNTTTTKIDDAKRDAMIKKEIEKLEKLNFWEDKKFRMDLAYAKDTKEKLSVMNKHLDGIYLRSGDWEKYAPEILKKLGTPAGAETGDDFLGSAMAFLGKGNMIKNAMDTATALYGASQVPFEMMMQQVKDRFEIATELRQSGLLEDMSSSFVDVTKAFSDNKMTIAEATQFVREFSKSVGVMGTTAALEFVNNMAYANDMMGRFGLSFSQVAKISGMYLDTLERTGMLEQISSAERDRGMKSFMSAVEGVSMTLKTSLEESAKMMRDYLGRDDVAAMLATNRDQLSQEVTTQISAMANMGPMGEVIAMGAIDPTRLPLTSQYTQLNQPGLSGIRSIIETMMVELRSGRATDEIIAQYGQQMADIINNDPVVGQLVAMDPELQKTVAGINRLAMTAQDAIKEIAVPPVDQEERRRQDAERRRAASLENMYATSLKSLENSERLSEILRDQTEIINTQIRAVDRMADSAGIIANILSVSAEANKMVMQSIASTAEYIVELLPKDENPAPVDFETATRYSSDKIEEDQDRLGRLVERELGQGVKNAIDDLTSKIDTWWVPFDEESTLDYLDRLNKIKESGTITDENGNVVTLDENSLAYIDTFIKQAEAEVSKGQLGRLAQNEVQFNNVLSTELSNTGNSLDDLNKTIESEDATAEEKNTARETINSAKKDVAAQQLVSAATTFSESDGKFFDAESTLLTQEVRNLLDIGSMTSEQMQDVIDGLKTNEEFKSSVGENFDKIITSMQAGLSENNQPNTPVAPPTVSINIPDTSEFMKTVMNDADSNLSNSDYMELYTKIDQVVGDTSVTANDQQITDMITEFANSRDLSQQELKELLVNVNKTLKDNSQKLSEATGNDDITMLITQLTSKVSSLVYELRK